MPTATILGKTYQTVVMPDGKEWMAENLSYEGLGVDNEAADALLGRLYSYASIPSIEALLSNGWHVPSRNEWDTMFLASGYPWSGVRYTGAEALKATSSAYWDAPNTGAAGAYSFNWAGAGYFQSGGYQRLRKTGGCLTATPDGTNVYTIEAMYDTTGVTYASNSQDGCFSVRLVRDPLPDVATPVISPASGYSAGPVSVEITCATADVAFHYTTDGSTPTEASPVCDGSLLLGSWVSAPITLKVLATASGHNSASIVSATYQFTAQAPMASLQMQAESGYTFSSFESKNARTAGTAGSAIFAGTLEWTLIDEEWAEFLAWWESTSEGVDPFDIYCTTGAVPLLHTCQAVRPYSFTRDTGVRKVSLPVKVLDRPTGLPAGWDTALVGPPASYPSAYIPMPQWGFKQGEAGLFLSTSGRSTASRPVATRGIELAFEWTGLSGYQFDVLVDWWRSTLAIGRRKFTVLLPGFEDTLLCRLSADPTFTVDGANFSASMDLVATTYRSVPLPSLGYLSDTWETTVADRLTDAFSDTTADTLYDSAGA